MGVTYDHLSSCIEPDLIRASHTLGSSGPKGREEPGLGPSIKNYKILFLLQFDILFETWMSIWRKASSLNIALCKSFTPLSSSGAGILFGFYGWRLILPNEALDN